VLRAIATAFLALFAVAGPVRAESIPHFAASARCSDKPAPSADACDFLDGAAELQIPPGGRVYRETWAGPFMGPTGHGNIELRIAPDGTRTLVTPWRQSPYLLKPYELRHFEEALAQSDFGQRPVHNQTSSVCLDGVGTALEAIVDGKYRLVYFGYCGGVSSESIAGALDQLFVFAAWRSGLRYPVNPEHPTFRGR
jgi:hypothetical protein